VSLQAIGSFKNPLGKVAFNAAVAPKKPLKEIVPGSFTNWDVVKTPAKIGWQQPIIPWKPNLGIAPSDL